MERCVSARLQSVMIRTSGDVRASYGSIVGNLLTTVEMGTEELVEAWLLGLSRHVGGALAERCGICAGWEKSEVCCSP